MPRILAFAGSTRADSFNRRLVALAAEKARAAGAEVTLLELAEFELPLYDGDREAAEGLPPGAVRLKALMVEHDAFLIACPEYNGSITPLLKNAIDWASRAADGEPPLVAYRGKLAALLAASPGALGGLRGLVHVRAILSGIGVLVTPGQFALSAAHKAFTDGGTLADAATDQRLDQLVHELVELTGKLHG